MGDDLFWRGRPPRSLVLRRMSIADKDRVVSPHESAVKCRANACIGLCTDDEDSPDSEVREYGFEVGIFE